MARSQMKNASWMGSMRWFAAEFAVVVSGILVALAMQAWWASKLDGKSELSLLRQMVVDLEKDSTALAKGVASDAAHMKATDFAAARLDARAPLSDTLLAAFTLLADISTPSLHTAQYATLKSRGLELISSDSLRSAIGQFYDVTGSSLEKHNAWERVAEARWMPIILRRFRMSRTKERTRTPRDYNALLSDQEFRLFLDEYAYYMNYTGPWKQSFLNSTIALLASVRAELKARGG